jgi:ABC-type transport system involved in multi-copper enzyme maturation permease subunit
MEPAISQVQAQPAQPYPVILWGSIGVVVLLVIANFFTRAGSIARATTKESLRQPVFALMTLIGLLIILANVFVPFFAMSDETKMFIDCGLATVLICSLLLAVWTASISVADEIEGKTAMTLLSKPITRRQFILGKYLGIVQSAWIMVALIGFFFFAMTYYKFGYDQRENSQEQPPIVIMKPAFGLPFDVPYMVKERLDVAMTVFPGLALIAMEVAVMASVSVAISTRFPMLFNFIACFAVFVVSHLTQVLAVSNVDNEFVKFFARVLATVLPGLEHLNMSAAVSTGKVIPTDYIMVAAAYCTVYAAMMIALAFLSFEDRDLA